MLEIWMPTGVLSLNVILWSYGLPLRSKVPYCVVIISPVNSFKDPFKVAEWEMNGGPNSEWWRDTEFLCPATLRAVCNLTTSVTNKLHVAWFCQKCTQYNNVFFYENIPIGSSLLIPFILIRDFQTGWNSKKNLPLISYV